MKPSIFPPLIAVFGARSLCGPPASYERRCRGTGTGTCPGSGSGSQHVELSVGLARDAVGARERAEVMIEATGSPARRTRGDRGCGYRASVRSRGAAAEDVAAEDPSSGMSEDGVVRCRTRRRGSRPTQRRRSRRRGRAARAPGGTLACGTDASSRPVAPGSTAPVVVRWATHLHDKKETTRDAPTSTIPVTLIPGDGIGPEVVTAARRIVEATGAPIEWEEHEAGAEVFKQGLPSRRPRGHDRLDRRARGSRSRARSRPRSGSARRARTSPSASSSRPTPTSARCASCPASRRPIPAAASTSSSCARTSRTSTPASSTCRRPAWRRRSS